MIKGHKMRIKAFVGKMLYIIGKYVTKVRKCGTYKI